MKEKLASSDNRIYDDKKYIGRATCAEKILFIIKAGAAPVTQSLALHHFCP